MARAISPNSRALSPRTKATRLARILKISVSRPCRSFHCTGSWLMRNVPSPKTCTTMTPGDGVLGPVSAGGGKSAGRPYCICGQTAMKMIKSTSRISISGTTFISETGPSFRPPSEIPMSHLAQTRLPREEDSHTLPGPRRGPREKGNSCCLLPGLELGRDQADSVDAGAAHDINGARHFREQYIVVAFDESDFLGALLEDRFKTRAEAVPGGVFVVDLQLVVHEHLHHDGLVLELYILLLVRIGLRHKRIEPVRRERSDDHENDEQHKQNVDQRN